MNRILDWLPLATLLAMMVAGRLRALAMRRRGVRAIIIDLRRARKERLYDTLMIGVAICWIYLLVAEAWPLSLVWLPGWLRTKLFDSSVVKLFGAALILVAPVLYLAALRSMGMSWRIGIDQKKPGPLVTSSLFAWTRNPIYTAFDLLIVGAFMIHQRVVSLIIGAVLVLMVHGIIRREERFLAARYGAAFGEYCGRVRRYGVV